jgi:endonuclease YncB( thermonuclease family)
MIVRTHRPKGRRLAALAAVLAFGAGALRAADEWLVYVGGGLEAVEGGWVERRGEVVFTQRGGTLVSVPHDEVDLAASAFITWQLGGRRRLPPRALLSPAPTEGTGEGECIGARLLGWRGSESLDVQSGEERELIHVACLDAPETQHRFAELGWFGRATLSALQLEIRATDVCLTESAPPQRDGDGHRIVHVTLGDGRDYAALVIASGLGLLRAEVCGRAQYYRGLEDTAIAGELGLWGPMAARPAMAAVSQVASTAGGAAPPRRRAAGGG